MTIVVDQNLIFDVGAHLGEDTEFYVHKGFKVIAIEANPEACHLIAKRCPEYIENKQLLVINGAVSNRSGKINFYINNDRTQWGTAKPGWVARNKALGWGRTVRVEVETVRLPELMASTGVPYYCKIDIEGNDLIALRSLAQVATRPPFVSIESEIRSWERLVEEFVAFDQLGYRYFNLVDQSMVPLQTCPQPAREGGYCENRFQIGSSGLFGRELPGRWVDKFEALELYKGIFVRYALNGNNGLFGRRTSIFHMAGQLQKMLDRVRGSSISMNPAYNLPPSGWYDTHAAMQLPPSLLSISGASHPVPQLSAHGAPPGASRVHE
jgi:FkbM family methyltransferase